MATREYSSAGYPGKHRIEPILPEPEDFDLGIGALASALGECERSIAAIQEGGDSLLADPTGTVVARQLANAIESHRHLLSLPSVQGVIVAFESRGITLTSATLRGEIARFAERTVNSLDAVQSLSLGGFVEAWIARQRPSGSRENNDTGHFRSISQSDSEKPRWEENCNIFRLGTEACVVATRGKRLRQVLDACQAADWTNPMCIPASPGSKSAISWLGDAVRDLNKAQSFVKFSRDGTGRGVRWRDNRSKNENL
jgi:hypothetical protein